MTKWFFLSFLIFTSTTALAETCKIRAYNLAKNSMDGEVLLWGVRHYHNVAFNGDVNTWQACYGKARLLADMYEDYWDDSNDKMWHGFDHVYFYWEFAQGSDLERTGSVNKHSPNGAAEGSQLYNRKGKYLGH